MTTVTVKLWGAGGGGGGGNASGGGAGAYVVNTSYAVTSGVGYTVTIGQGGQGGQSATGGTGGSGFKTGGNGSAGPNFGGGGGGGSSLFDTLVASGGGGGCGGSTSSTINAASGTSGGTGFSPSSTQGAGGGGGSNTNGSNAVTIVGGAGGTGGTTQTGTNGKGNTNNDSAGGSAAGTSGNGNYQQAQYWYHQYRLSKYAPTWYFGPPGTQTVPTGNGTGTEPNADLISQNVIGADENGLAPTCYNFGLDVTKINWFDGQHQGGADINPSNTQVDYATFWGDMARFDFWRALYQTYMTTKNEKYTQAWVNQMSNWVASEPR